MTTDQQREQERAEARARHQKFVTEQRAKLTGLLDAVSMELIDLLPVPQQNQQGRTYGFRIGGVTVELGYGPSYGYSRAERAPDRIEVCYSERTGWRSRRKTLTYTRFDGKFCAKLAARVREIVAALAVANEARTVAEAEERAARLAAEARLAPVLQAVETFTMHAGTRHHDARVSERYTDRFELKLLLTADEVSLVLDALQARIVREGE